MLQKRTTQQDFHFQIWPNYIISIMTKETNQIKKVK